MLRISLVLFAVSLVFSSSARADCRLRVGWQEWFPYIHQVGGKFQGSEYELLQTIAKAAACSLQMVEVPWSRSLRMLRAGELDVVYAAGFTAERAEIAKFSLPYRYETIMLVTKKGADLSAEERVSLGGWLAEKSASDTPRSVGAIQDNFYGEQINAILGNRDLAPRVSFVSDDAQMIAMLTQGRIDGYLIEQGLVESHRQRTPGDFLARRVSEQQPEPLHYMFSKATPQVVIDRFNKAIEKHRSLAGAPPAAGPS